MGEKQPSVRTLPTGEQVTNYPDGRDVLVPQNRLSALLADQHDDQEAASAAITENLVQAAADKRDALTSGDAVPTDKCVV